MVDAFGRRTCRVGRNPRREIERELKLLAVKAGPDARTWPAILATLDKCFSGCKKMDDNVGHCTLRGKSCTCRQRWIEFLVFHECAYVPR